MARITITDLKTLNFATVEDLQSNLDIIKNEINGNLDNDNIKAGANIDPGKVADGGAVTVDETTTTGLASRIPKLDANGDLLIGRRLVFLEGNI
jgi:hypothetical protein